MRNSAELYQPTGGLVRQHHIGDTIYRIRYGRYWSDIYLAALAVGVELPRITDCLSMQFSGYCAPALRGVIYRLITGIGRMSRGVFAVGGRRVCGKNSWKLLLMTPIMNG